MATKIGQVEIKIDRKLMKQVEERAKDALVLTGTAVINEILSERIIPKASGIMEGTLQPLDVSDLDSGVVRIWSNTPYARRHYYNEAGVTFHRQPWAGGQGNANAQDHWFEPWISGVYAQGVRDKFEHYLGLTK